MKQYVIRYKNVLISCLVAATMFVLTSASTSAATLTVNSTADVSADDGQCTLREAISSINSTTASGASGGECVAGDGSNDAITLPADIIQLTSDFPALTAPMTIRGVGIGQTVIDGNDGTTYVVFSSDSSLSVTDLTIRDFEGAAINSVDDDLTVKRVEIDGTNSLNDTGFLVGIALLGSDPSLSVEDSYIHDIVGDDAPAVGGIFMGVANSSPAQVRIERTSIVNVQGPLTAGGIIFSTGAFDGNNFPASINAIIRNNTVTEINSFDETESSAAAAVLLSSFLVGGVNNFDINVANNTFTNIKHSSGSGSVFAAVVFTGGSDDTQNVSLTFTNNILASQSPLVDCSLIAQGDGNENLSAVSVGGTIAAGNSCLSVFNHSTDQNNIANIATSLGSLTDNGGYVPTMALLDGSPALNSGVAVSGLTTDARGITRPQGAAYDSGAYEREVSVAGGALATLANTGEKIVLYVAGGLLLVLVSGTALFISRRR